MFDQPVPKLFLEKFESHLILDQKNSLWLHLRDHGCIVVDIHFPSPCLKLVQHELDGAIQPGTAFKRVAQSDEQVTYNFFFLNAATHSIMQVIAHPFTSCHS